MRKLCFLILALVFAAGSALAQKAMSPPTVMIVPDLIYCKTNGYVIETETGVVPDYEKALSEDPTLHAVLTQIAQLINDRNPDIVIVDLIEAINNARADQAMAQANGGDDSESVDEAIIRNSNADILIKVQYDLVKNGPENRVSYTLTGTDPYTSTNFAPVEGLGQGSTSASPVVLLREAVYKNMDSFLDKVLSHYLKMVNGGGRMVAFEIKTRATSSHTMNSRVGQYTLREEIEDFLYDNSVEGKGIENVKSGNTFMQYKGVYIPVIATIRGRQRKQGAKDVALKLVNHLEGMGVNAEYKILGLGKAVIYID